MNGSEAMVRTLLANDISVCFANPGTSEMHFVSALDRLPQMRCVLGLFEGVVTGAADGYFRMAGKPAATLLHLGSGLGNGLANLHNAKRARSGIVNIIGEHASDHIANDAPLTSDIAGIARPVSHWVRTCASSDTAPNDTADAVQAASGPPARIASLILPADAAWGDNHTGPAARREQRDAPVPSSRLVDAAAAALKAGAGKPGSVALLLGGRAMRADVLALAGQIAARTGCALYSESKNARAERGLGRVNIPQVPYPVSEALDALKDVRHLILIDAIKPVAFFGYPDKPRHLVHPDCKVETLATFEEDPVAALEALNDVVGGSPDRVAWLGATSELPDWRGGSLDSLNIGRVLAATIPEQAIVVDEAITTGRQFLQSMRFARPHDWLELPGGAIGFGLPCATGAAVACPDRKVVAVVGDGSAMYTVQALWTMAREGLDVTVVICANRKYQILRGELAAMGGPPPAVNAQRMLTLDGPDLDWVHIAQGQGMQAVRADSLEGFATALARGLQVGGPNLIELVM